MRATTTHRLAALLAAAALCSTGTGHALGIETVMTQEQSGDQPLELKIWYPSGAADTARVQRVLCR